MKVRGRSRVCGLVVPAAAAQSGDCRFDSQHHFVSDLPQSQKATELCEKSPETSHVTILLSVHAFSAAGSAERITRSRGEVPTANRVTSFDSELCDSDANKR